MNPSPVLMYQQCVADTSGGGELRLESQNHEDTSLALPTQVLSGIYVSGSLPLPGSTHAHFTPSCNHFQCDAECALSVPHMTGSLLQNHSPVWALVPALQCGRLSPPSRVGACPRPPGDSSPSAPQPQGPDLKSLSFSACPMLCILDSWLSWFPRWYICWSLAADMKVMLLLTTLMSRVTSHVSLLFHLHCLNPLSLESTPAPSVSWLVCDVLCRASGLGIWGEHPRSCWSQKWSWGPYYSCSKYQRKCYVWTIQ